jgi:general secretion pathway protein G
MHAIQKRRAFSLIELVIVIVIIGIIGAIAIPRMSRGAAGAADSAVTANLAVLRNAVDHYQIEHGGNYPTDHTTIADQLLKFTDDNGNTSDTRTEVFVYGPYLRAIPPLPVAPFKGEADFTNDPSGATRAGWYYDKDTGQVKANSTEKDVRGKAYNTY